MAKKMKKSKSGKAPTKILKGEQLSQKQLDEISGGAHPTTMNDQTTDIIKHLH